MSPGVLSPGRNKLNNLMSFEPVANRIMQSNSITSQHNTEIEFSQDSDMGDTSKMRKMKRKKK